ncbi:MAG: hypothetical protein ACLFUT_06685, partial [Desulfobacteraceae bacterium]
ETRAVTKPYTHQLNTEFHAISGTYVLEKEIPVEVNGRAVLCAVGNAVVDSSCCGMGGCRYALVPGYVKRLKKRKNEAGLWISEVEPVADPEIRKEITRRIQKEEWVNQVQFWD